MHDNMANEGALGQAWPASLCLMELRLGQMASDEV